MTRTGATVITLVLTAALVVAGTDGAVAQIKLPPLVPTTAPPDPATTTTTAPQGLVEKLLKPAPSTVPAPAPAPTAKAQPASATAIPGNPGGEGIAPPPDAGPFPAHLAAMMNSVRRTRPNNSNGLVDALKALTDLGIPIEEAMRVGMGRFPVAGRVNYSHDWWYPRFGPGWRLHQGTDLFGATGTPIRSPANGVVRFGDGGLGGISTYVTQADGTYFYMAHLAGRPPGLKNGQTVNVGDIVGFLGSSGNAEGGSPHLHFEVHPAIRIVTVGKGKRQTTKAVSAPVRPGTVLPAIDPKPLLDLYLSEAMSQLPSIVANYQANPALVQAALPATTAGPAVPAETAAIAGRHLAKGGLIAADAPLARTPLLLLAFLLMVMVLVLAPVLLPKKRLVSGAPVGRHAAEKHAAKARAAPAEAPVGVATASAGPTGRLRRVARAGKATVGKAGGVVRRRRQPGGGAGVGVGVGPGAVEGA